MLLLHESCPQCFTDTSEIFFGKNDCSFRKPPDMIWQFPDRIDNSAEQWKLDLFSSHRARNTPDLATETYHAINLELHLKQGRTCSHRKNAVDESSRHLQTCMRHSFSCCAHWLIDKAKAPRSISLWKPTWSLKQKTTSWCSLRIKTCLSSVVFLRLCFIWFELSF